MSNVTHYFKNCEHGQYSAGDTALLMCATSFVMLQTPAMGIAQAGMIRRKNSLSMLMQTITGLCIGSILWFIFGFSLTFGPTYDGLGVIGNLDYVFFVSVPMDDCLPHLSATTIPALVFAAFQMMFALMVPVIVTGSWAEKMTFRAFLMFVTLWPVLVYYPLAHWVWNVDGWLARFGVLDFAGGITIHTSSGVAGLVVSIVLQKRKRFRHLVDAAHSIPLSIVGGVLIWVGWYSFNAGSAYKANLQACVALMNTHISSCTSAMTWVLSTYSQDGKWHVTEIIGGALAGLAAITPGSGYVPPYCAFVIGILAGGVSYAGVRFFKVYLELDDVLDVTSLQGVPGATGSILVGAFASAHAQGFTGTTNGLFFGGGFSQLGKQCVGVLVAATWSGFWTYVIMTLMAVTVGIDISAEEEEMGLDLCQIGEKAYDTDLNPTRGLSPEALVIKLCEAANAGEVREMRRLVTAGADPSAADYDGRTPAHLAASEGHIDVLRFLATQHGVDLNAVDAYGGTPLQDAVRQHRTSAVAWLRKRGARLHSTSDLAAELRSAASQGRSRQVQELIRGGVDLNDGDYDSRTALHLAAAEGRLAVVEALIAGGADGTRTDRWGAIPLSDARRFGHLAVAALLQAALPASHPQAAAASYSGPVDGTASGPAQTALVSLPPSAAGSPDLSTALLGEGSSLYQYGAATGAAAAAGAAGGTSGKRTLERRDSVRITAGARELCEAASQGDLSEVKRLVKKGADPNTGDYDQRTPIHLAAAAGHLAVVQYLASLPNAHINCLDRWKRTPLQDAISHDNHDIVTWLRSAGAVVINRPIGHALCAAAASGNLSRLRQLFAGGADLGLADYDGRTALHLAAAEGQMDVLRWLLAHGVSPSPSDRYSGTPLTDAERSGHHAAAVLLREALADAAAVASTTAAAEEQELKRE